MSKNLSVKDIVVQEKKKSQRIKRIAMYQSRDEYPVLNIIITDNVRYWKERMVCETVEEALEKIELWLRRNVK